LPRFKGKRQIQLKEALEDIIPAKELPFIPSRWWFVGDIVILPIPKQLEKYSTEIGSAMLHLEGKKRRTVLGKFGPTEGITRIPDFEYLAGDKNTETIHKELGCKFKIDAAKLTFSPGNIGERKRLLDLVSKNEFIVDMFSCIGNLSLPIAVHKAPKQLIAAEINPTAFRYLEENIKLNRVEDIMKGLLGDNRNILSEFEGKANRVISGYFDVDEEQIRLAFRLCKDNATAHFHLTVPANKELQEQRIAQILALAEKGKRRIANVSRKRVKKYAPGIEHIVLDVDVI
jgi:tRNA wybutosine-synthesizing protein 2